MVIGVEGHALWPIGYLAEIDGSGKLQDRHLV